MVGNGSQSSSQHPRSWKSTLGYGKHNGAVIQYHQTIAASSCYQEKLTNVSKANTLTLLSHRFSRKQPKVCLALQIKASGAREVYEAVYDAAQSRKDAMIEKPPCNEKISQFLLHSLWHYALPTCG